MSHGTIGQLPPMFKKLLLTIAVFSFPALVYAQVATTTPIFGQDACNWIETEDGTVVNNICGKTTVTDGSYVDNGDGTFSLTIGGGSGNIGIGTENLLPVFTLTGTNNLGPSNGFYVLPNGNVGIGTPTPEKALTVIGTTKTSVEFIEGTGSVLNSSPRTYIILHDLVGSGCTRITTSAGAIEGDVIACP